MIFLALLVDGQQFQHGRPAALPGLRSGNRLLERIGHVDRQRIVDAEDLSAIHRSALRHVQFVDQPTHFFHVAGCCIDNQAVRARVGCRFDAWPQAVAGTEELRNRLLDRGHRRMLQRKHRKLGFRRHRPVELRDQLDHRIHRFAPADQQQGVGLDQRGHRHAALPAANQVLLDFVDDLLNRFTLRVLAADRCGSWESSRH